MFTLKLYRRLPDIGEGIPQHKHFKVLSVHHTLVMEIGAQGRALELWTFPTEASMPYETYYIGEPEPQMEAWNQPTHLDYESGSWWGWGLLENAEGKTTQHFRPANYG